MQNFLTTIVNNLLQSDEVFLPVLSENHLILLRHFPYHVMFIHQMNHQSMKNPVMQARS